MCCFAGPLACAAAARVVRGALSASHHDAACKVQWLEKLMLGGSALLALEHVWHGEIALQAPFLTAGSAAVLREIATVGSAMSAALLLVWSAMLLVSAYHERKAQRLSEEA